MDREEILRILEETGAIQHGHFELSSGLHSGTYIQCARVLQYPWHAESLGRALGTHFADRQTACVVSPAIGGLIIGHETGRALGTRAIFCERDEERRMTLRRGFVVEAGERVVVIEDVWTTGGSTEETIRVVREAGGDVRAAGALIDRSGGAIRLTVPSSALLAFRVDSFEKAACVLCRSGVPVEKPGSRFTASSKDGTVR
jgi:orotate phosphoribosyltransferase